MFDYWAIHDQFKSRAHSGMYDGLLKKDWFWDGVNPNSFYSFVTVINRRDNKICWKTHKTIYFFYYCQSSDKVLFVSPKYHSLSFYECLKRIKINYTKNKNFCFFLCLFKNLFILFLDVLALQFTHIESFFL
jgi:hypothetical protein